MWYTARHSFTILRKDYERHEKTLISALAAFTLLAGGWMMYSPVSLAPSATVAEQSCCYTNDGASCCGSYCKAKGDACCATDEGKCTP